MKDKITQFPSDEEIITMSSLERSRLIGRLLPRRIAYMSDVIPSDLLFVLNTTEVNPTWVLTLLKTNTIARENWRTNNFVFSETVTLKKLSKKLVNSEIIITIKYGLLCSHIKEFEELYVTESDLKKVKGRVLISISLLQRNRDTKTYSLACINSKDIIFSDWKDINDFLLQVKSSLHYKSFSLDKFSNNLTRWKTNVENKTD